MCWTPRCSERSPRRPAARRPTSWPGRCQALGCGHRGGALRRFRWDVPKRGSPFGLHQLSHMVCAAGLCFLPTLRASFLPGPLWASWPSLRGQCPASGRPVCWRDGQGAAELGVCARGVRLSREEPRSNGGDHQRWSGRAKDTLPTCCPSASPHWGRLVLDGHHSVCHCQWVTSGFGGL